MGETALQKAKKNIAETHRLPDQLNRASEKRAEVARLQKNILAKEGLLRQLSGHSRQYTRELSQKNSEFTGIDAEVSRIDTQLERNQNTIGVNVSRIKTIEAKIRTLRNQKAPFLCVVNGDLASTNIEPVRTRDFSSEKEPDEVQAEIRRLQAEKKLLVSENSGLESNNSALRIERKHSVSHRDAIQSEVTSLRGKIDEVARSQRRHEDEKNQLILQKDQLQDSASLRMSQIARKEKNIAGEQTLLAWLQDDRLVHQKQGRKDRKNLDKGPEREGGYS